jgi:hypothetical protein
MDSLKKSGHQLEGSHPPPTESRTTRTSSLFGAVMKKIGSNAMLQQSTQEQPQQENWQSPTRPGNRPLELFSNNSMDGNDNNSIPNGGKVNESSSPTSTFSATANAVGDVVNRLIGKAASPSGKTIMDIVNRFNSPFRFSSPDRKRTNHQQSGRQLWRSPSPNRKSNVFTTPSPRKRRRLDLDAELETSHSHPLLYNNINNDNKNSNSNTINNNDANNSNLSEASASNWREIPIVSVVSYSDDDGDDDTKQHPITIEQLTILDFSLHSRLQFELHAPPPFANEFQINLVACACGNNKDFRREWNDALCYWEFRPRVITSRKREGDFEASTTTVNSWEWPTIKAAKSSPFLKNSRRQGSMGTIGKGTVVSRAASLIMETSKQQQVASVLPPTCSSSNTAQLNPQRLSNTTSFSFQQQQQQQDLAKHLIHLVRGPQAILSRKCQWPDNGSWELMVHQHYDDDDNDDHLVSFKNESRIWQRAFRSLFQKFCDKIRGMEMASQLKPNGNDSSSSSPSFFLSFTLDTYFYVMGVDHITLFRIGRDHASGIWQPSVVMSKTTVAFRESLQKHGVSTIHLLTTKPEKQQTCNETSSRSSATKLFATETPTTTTNPLLSPSIDADLEALRRAQAFGESAGADVFVKIKKPRPPSVLPKRNPFQEPMTICGWDNVQVFFEVYLNTLGCISPQTSCWWGGEKSLPTLLCHQAMGPFEYSSMKRLQVLPTPPKQTEAGVDSKNANPQVASVDICGPILPSVARKLLVVGRNCLLQDEANRPSIPTALNINNNNNNDIDSSRYLVLQTLRSNKTSKNTYDRAKDSLVFNQGTTEDETLELLFECPIGKSLSMAVWDSSRQDVVACKLEDDNSTL